MALKATIYKAELQIADLDRNYYHDHTLTLARHPSETDERLMVRLLAFVMNASMTMEFGRGISSDDEPALWQKDLTGAIERWIEVGQPDERALRKACGRAERVIVYAYGRAVDLWWKQNASAFAKLDKLTVFMLPGSECAALAALAERNMHLQCTVQEGQLLWSGGADAVQIEPQIMQAAS